MTGVPSMLVRILTIGAFAALSACNQVSHAVNPFYEPPSEVALQGQPNDHALAGQHNKIDSARQALEAMASYKRAQAPQPVNPVMQPAVVRLMWVPDHLNSHGDLVPAHYYYLKVLKERWAVSDAYELEGQLGSKKSAGNVPFVREGDGISR